MRKLLLAAMAAAALASGGATHAADLGFPAAAPVLAPAPVLTWTGFYVGVNGGGGWGQTAHDFTGVIGGLGAATGNFKTNGGLAGGTVGYNYQAGAWVAGVEGDFNWANIKGTFTAAIPAVATGSLSTELKWLNTVRGRVGYTWGPSMIYLTGGAAYGNVTATAAGTIPAVAASGSTSETVTRLGWTAGAGYEHMFTPNLTGKVEYLYVDLGSETQILVDNVKFNTNIVRGGLNWKF